jgi:lipid A disaccharide synthetase
MTFCNLNSAGNFFNTSLNPITFARFLSHNCTHPASSILSPARQGIKTVHFISPSVWAWRKNRIKKIKKSTDLVLCLFPFEVDFYQQHAQRAVFVGHPLAESLHPRQDYQSTKTVLLMPGSRESEVKRLLPELLAAVVIIKKQDSKLNFHIALANDELLESNTAPNQWIF